MRLDNPLRRYAEKINSPSNVLDYEKKFSLPEKIFNVESGCPICYSNIKGNRNMGFHCEKCNLIFTEKNIVDTKKIINTKKMK
jgi:tRNA(Ile2) C34 agmatinyltransferase TiaS